MSYKEVLEIFEYLYNEYDSIKPEFIAERYGAMMLLVEVIQFLVSSEEVKK